MTHLQEILREQDKIPRGTRLCSINYCSIMYRFILSYVVFKHYQMLVQEKYPLSIMMHTEATEDINKLTIPY